jgi:hypothetical protein
MFTGATDPRQQPGVFLWPNRGIMGGQRGMAVTTHNRDIDRAFIAFRKMKTFVRRKDTDLIGQHLDELIAKTDFTKIRIDYALRALERRVKFVDAERYKILSLGAFPAILLLLAIVGINFHVSMFDINFSGIFRFQELILIYLTVSEIIFMWVTEGLSYLRILQKKLEIIKFGKGQLPLVEILHEHGLPTMIDPRKQFGDRYQPRMSRLLAHISSVLILLAAVLALAVGIVAIHVVILVHILSFPNWSMKLENLIVGGCLASLVVMFTTTLMDMKYSFWYLDQTSAATFFTGEANRQEFTEFYQANRDKFRRKKLSGWRMIGVVVLLIAIAFLL